MNTESYTLDLKNSTNNTVADFTDAQIDNQIILLKQEIIQNIKLEIKQEKIEIRRIFFTNREIKIYTIFFLCSLLLIFLMYYLMFDSISISLFIVLSLSFYGYVLVKHRWFVDEGTLEYYNKKMSFSYDGKFNEINYSNIFRIEKEKSFIRGMSFFIYSKENKEATIKFNSHDATNIMNFENKMKNKNISINNL